MLILNVTFMNTSCFPFLTVISIWRRHLARQEVHLMQHWPQHDFLSVLFFLWRSESPFCWGRETPLTQVVEFLYFLNELNPSRSPEEPLSPQTWNTPWCIHWHQLTTFFSGLQSTADHLLTNSDHRSHLTDLTLSDYPDRALNWIRWPWTHCSEMKPHLSPSGMWQSGSSQVGWRPLGSSLWCCQKTCFID